MKSCRVSYGKGYLTEHVTVEADSLYEAVLVATHGKGLPEHAVVGVTKPDNFHDRVPLATAKAWLESHGKTEDEERGKQRVRARLAGSLE